MKKAPSDYKILVVDDHMISIRLLQTHLQVAGFMDIEIATNGDEASEQLKSGHFDIVFMDWAMPQRDGITVLRECRAEPRFDSTAFVMVSAEAQRKNIIEALAAGATAYIVKPLSQDELKDPVAKVLKWLENRAVDSGNVVNA